MLSYPCTRSERINLPVDITVYLPNELGVWAKQHGLNLSRMLRDAVLAEQDRQEAVKAAQGEIAVHRLFVDGYVVRLHAREVASATYIGGGVGHDERLYETQDGRILVYDGIAGVLYSFDADDEANPTVTVTDPECWQYGDRDFYVALMTALGREPVFDIGVAGGNA